MHARNGRIGAGKARRGAQTGWPVPEAGGAQAKGRAASRDAGWCLVPAWVVEGHPRRFPMLVEGRCMEPLISDGDTAVVDPDVPVRDGCIAAVVPRGFPEVEGRVGVASREGDAWRVSDLDGGHPRLYPDADVLGVCPVVWAGAAEDCEPPEEPGEAVTA